MSFQIPRGQVVVVNRGTGKVRAGQGMLKGLGVVWHHFVGSFKKLDNFTQTSGTFTMEYPDEQRILPEAYRNMPILLYDDETGQELCTGCFQCQRICPPQVIHITQAKDPTTGKVVPAATEFLIEYDACMSCGFCAEVCPFDSIKMDHQFELSTNDRPSLTIDKAGLSRPISYYVEIAPTLWAEVQESAYKKLQGSAKRRPGLIGIAPPMIERIKAARAAAPPPVETAPAPVAPKPAPAPVAPKPAPTASASGEPVGDKAARLAAIRAANTAKQGGETPPAPAPAAPPADDKAARLAAIRAANVAKQGGEAAPAAPPPAPAAPPADDKAARLAAIRAANAAKQGGTAQAAAPAAAAPEPPTPAAAPEPPASATTMPDDKAARLAAIRAANASKKQS